jgi:hypothetical protein
MRKLVIALLSIAACGPDSGSGSIAIGDLGDALVSSYCDLYVRCGVVADQASCEQLFGTDVNVDADIIAAVEAGKVIYHGDKARECLNGFFTGTCDRSMIFGNRSQPTACDETFEGTVGDAGICAIDEECISQDCVVPQCPDACCQGTCMGATAPGHPTVGQACGPAIPTCSNSFCDTTTLLCTAYIADGGACMSNSSCQTGLCDQTTHTCQTLVATGGACMNSTQCKLIGDSCPQGTMQCTPVGGIGTMCGTTSDCQANLSCDGTQHCIARPTVGQSCATSTGCLDSYCDTTTTTCTARKADGAACMTSSECISSQCDTTSHTCTTDPVCI